MPVSAAESPVFSHRLYNSVADVDEADWSAVVRGDDLAMDRRLIIHTERSLADQARFWTLVVRDAGGKPVACACLALFRVDAAMSAPPMVQAALAKVRTVWPGCLRMGVLFCGLPLPSGSSHLRIIAGADVNAVFDHVARVMRRLARGLGAKLIVFKEMDYRQAAQCQRLVELGLIRGEVPAMHVLQGPFDSFESYRQALRSGYRRQVDQSLRRFTQEGFTVEHHDDPAAIARLFDDDMHRLYRAVWERSTEKLEYFGADFFRGLARELPGVSLTVLRRGQRAAAFSIGIRRGRAYHNLYIGVDYALNEAGHLYFNLFYHELDQALRQGARRIYLGQTSDQFKSRLGCLPMPLFFYVRAAGGAGNLLLRRFRGVIFPRLEPVMARDVFKNPAAAAPSPAEPQPAAVG